MISKGGDCEWREQISQPEYQIAEERDVYVDVRDGVEIAVNVFRPDAEGTFPALFAMAGYGKETQDLDYPPQPLGESAMWDGTIEAGDPREIVPRGYVHVVADVRGTGDSGGEYTGMMASKEGKDGHDVIEWIAEQPWCDGNVGMSGYSYFSFTTLKTAIEQPEHLKAIYVSHALADFYRESVYPGGVLNMFYYGLWDGRNGSSGIAANNPASVMLQELSEQELERRKEELLEDPAIRNRPNLYHTLKYPFMNPPFFDFLLNPYDGEFWEERSIYPFFDQIDVPVHVIGKSPHSLTGYWGLYQGIEAPKKLTVKPPGPEERPWREDGEMFIRWWDHWLKGNDTGVMGEAPIDLFVAGANEWRKYDEWPLPDIQWEELYLRRRGKLLFRPEMHQKEPDAFVQEPLHVTSERKSVKYVSPAVPGDLEVIGPVALNFYASIDQDDTTWVISLSDVSPSGEETRLAKAYFRASHRALDHDRSEKGRPYHPHTLEAAEPVEPGEVTEYNVGLDPITHVFNPGHRVKLTIENMESPLDEEMHVHYHPHVTSGRTTVHRIYRNDNYQSHLEIPTHNTDESVIAMLGDDNLMRGH
ncbi:CocE/NonD family hydrolase [Halobellus rufus]|uniref:CocE/NonD family hydrolase n=1 Tax=Halobellus rufus TaxID=1448860 RepID=UPI0006786AC4|nr:CocE/NonD family hydrolase [Halobellus rufus]